MVFLQKCFVFSIILFFYCCPSFSYAFIDINPSTEYYEAIEWAEKNEVVKGFTDDTFRPNQKVTRAEFLKLVLLRRYTEDEINSFEVKAQLFSDVSKNNWFYQYVYFAYDKDIIQGYSDGRFDPYGFINFAESSKILSVGLVPTLEEDLYIPADKEWSLFYRNVLWAKFGLDYSPYENNLSDDITRAQTVHLIFQLIGGNIAQKEITSYFGFFPYHPEKVLIGYDNNYFYYSFGDTKRSFPRGNLKIIKGNREIPISELSEKVIYQEGGLYIISKDTLIVNDKIFSFPFDNTTFKIIDFQEDEGKIQFIVKDKDNIYFYSDKASSTIKKNNDIKIDLFYKQMRIINDEVDISSFSALRDGFYKDNNAYYKLSLEQMDGYILKKIEYSSLPLRVQNYKSMEGCENIKNSNYYKKNGTIWYECQQELQGVDVESFKILSLMQKNFGYDNKSFYNKAKIVSNISPKNITSYDIYYYFSNINSVFLYDEITDEFHVLEGADPSSFTSKLNTLSITSPFCYVSDYHSVFFGSKRIEKADRKTFKVLESISDYSDENAPIIYAKDKNNYYKNGEVISTAEFMEFIVEMEKKKIIRE